MAGENEGRTTGVKSGDNKRIRAAARHDWSG